MNNSFPSKGAVLMAFAAGLAFLSGCMVGPDYHPPKTQTPAAWAGMTNSQEAAETKLTDSPADLAQWWTHFQDPELDQLIKLALRTNLDLRLAETLLLESRAARSRDAGGLWPTLTATGSAAHNGKVSGGGSHNTLSAGGAAVWNLDFFGTTRRQLEADTAAIQSAQESLYNAEVTLTSEVALDYIQVRAAQDQIAIAQTNLQSELHTAEVTRQKAAAGFDSALDEANAEAQVASTAASIPPLETTIRQNIYALSILLDRPPADLVDELSKPGPRLMVPPNIPLGLPSELLRRRPDVRMAEAGLHQAAAQVGVAVADFYPQFSLTGSLNYQSSAARDLLAGPNGTYGFGPQVTWPIFSGGSTISTLRYQKAAKDAAYISYQKTVLSALGDVENYLVAFSKEWEHRQALAEAATKNRRAFELSQQLYSAGTTEFLTVLDAERSVLGSETALSVSQQSILSDMVNIYRALGGGWTEHD